MKRAMRWLSASLCVFALLAVSVLLISDLFNDLRLSSLHQQTGALAFILIGAAFVVLQFCSRKPLRENLKELLVGIAFLLWGSEQFLPSSRWVTAIDVVVVLIFVVDLSLIIFQRIRRPEAERLKPERVPNCEQAG
jgi:FtsH-binding integral membrane protein